MLSPVSSWKANNVNFRPPRYEARLAYWPERLPADAGCGSSIHTYGEIEITLDFPPLAPKTLPGVTSSSGLVCSGEPCAPVLWCLLVNLLVLHQNLLLHQQRHTRQSQDDSSSTTQHPADGEYHFLSLLEKALFYIFDFALSLVVPWGLVVGDGEPFDIELYPPGWLI